MDLPRIDDTRAHGPRQTPEYMPGARVRYRDEPEVQGTVSQAIEIDGVWRYYVQWDYPKGFVSRVTGRVLKLGTLPDA